MTNPPTTPPDRAVPQRLAMASVVAGASAGALLLARWLPVESALPAAATAAAMLLAYGLAGGWCNRRAMRGDVVACIAWGLVGKSLRSVVLACAVAAIVTSNLVSREPFLLTVAIGWFACLGVDLYVLARYRPGVNAQSTPHTLPEPSVAS